MFIGFIRFLPVGFLPFPRRGRRRGPAGEPASQKRGTAFLSPGETPFSQASEGGFHPGGLRRRPPGFLSSDEQM